MEADVHWHGFAFTGQYPTDSQARDPLSSTPPREIALWLRKPRTMMTGTFRAPGDAYDWLAKELHETPPPEGAVSVHLHLQHAEAALGHGRDAHVGYYTPGGSFLVRTVLTCPRPGERCPGAPSTSARGAG